MSLYDINGNVVSESNGNGSLDLKKTDGILDTYTSYTMTEYSTSQTTEADANGLLTFTFENMSKGDILKWKRAWNGQNGTISVDGVSPDNVTWTSYVYGTYMLTSDASKVVIKTKSDELESALVLHRDESFKERPAFYDEYIPTVNDEEDTVVKSLSSSKIFDLYGGSAKRLKEALNGKTVIFMGDSYTKGAESQFVTLCEKYGATADNYGIVSSSICGDTTGNKGYQPMWNRTATVCSTYETNGNTSDIGAIVFMGGANDGIGISTWIGSGINDDDTGHIYGALNSIMDNFRSTFDCPIFVILQPTFPNGTTANQIDDDETAILWGFDNAAQCSALDSDHFARYGMYNKQTAVKAVAEYHDCHIVDCFFNYDISVFRPNDKAIYWGSDGHPTAEGYQHIADYSGSVVKTKI